MKSLKKFLAGVVLSAVCLTQAHAMFAEPVQRTFDFGTLNGSAAFSNLQVSTSFDDIFFFSIGSGSGVSGSFVGLDLFGDFTSLLFRGGIVGQAPTPWSVVPVVSDGDGVFSLSAATLGLAPGTQYFFELQGIASAASYSVTLAPVPEPENWALMLAGMGIVGVIVRRRRSTAGESS